MIAPIRSRSSCATASPIPIRAAEVASRLILSDKVDLMLVASTPETTNPVSDQCEVNGTPCVSTVAPWQPWFFARGGKPEVGFKSTYHFFWGSRTSSASSWTCGTACRRTRWWAGCGRTTATATPGAIPSAASRRLTKAGYKVVDPGRYPNLTDDFSAQIATFKNEKVEIVTGVPLPGLDDLLEAGRPARVPAQDRATVGKALLFPRSVEALGDLGDGMSTEVWWSPYHPFKSSLTATSAAAYAAAYTRETKKQWTQPLGFIHALFEVGLDATKRAASLDDKSAIIAAIKATNLNTIVGPVSWAKGPCPT